MEYSAQLLVVDDDGPTWDHKKACVVSSGRDL